MAAMARSVVSLRFLMVAPLPNVLGRRCSGKALNREGVLTILRPVDGVVKEKVKRFTDS